MGNVEKWVVLGVLALIVGILVVSLNVDDPLKKDKVVLAGGSDKPAVAASDVSKSEAAKADAGLPPAAHPDATQSSGGGSGSPLLNASVDTSAPTSTPTIPSGSILKTMEGLQESYMTDAMFYTWKNGDTFPILAQRFYGDASRLAILKRINEGRTEVQPGERVLVPLYDLDAVQAPAPTAPVAGTSAALTTPTKAGAPKKSEAAAPVASTATSPTGARVHIVKDGESLWKIAKQELGSGARWNEIYSANRDVLASPEALHTGQKLRVP
jgi:nucleoid-associated protein YgaU